MPSLGPLVRGCHVVALALALGTTVSVGCRSKPQVVEEAAVAGPSCSNTVSDSANCGACGQACIAGPCQSSTCRVRLLTWLRRSDDYAFAADDRHVYYVAAYAGSVARIPVEGGPREIVASKGSEKEMQPRPLMTMSRDNVFWVWKGNHVHTLEKKGGSATELFVDERRVVHVLRTIDDELWWSSMVDASAAELRKGSLNRFSAGKQVPVGLPFDWIAPDGDATSLVLFEDDESGNLVEYAHATKRRVLLAKFDKDARILHFDAKSVYVHDSAGLIKQVSRHTPGPVRTLYAPPEKDHVTGTHLDAHHLWVTLRHSAVRVALADGSVTPLVDQWAPHAGYLETANATGLVLSLYLGEGKRAKRALVRVDK